MTKIFYLMALLHRACTMSAEPVKPVTPHIHTSLPSQKNSPLHAGIYALISRIFHFPHPATQYLSSNYPDTLARKILNDGLRPAIDFYAIAKKKPTAYPLLTSTDFIALEDAPLEDGDVIITEPSRYGPELSFGIMAHKDTVVVSVHDSSRIKHIVSPGNVTIYSRYAHPDDEPLVETYDKTVTPREQVL